MFRLLLDMRIAVSRKTETFRNTHCYHPQDHMLSKSDKKASFQPYHNPGTTTAQSRLPHHKCLHNLTEHDNCTSRRSEAQSNLIEAQYIRSEIFFDYLYSMHT
jgi:hypothetical protein